MYKSIRIKDSDDFYDIIRFVDKIQFRKSKNLMTSQDVKKLLRLHELAKPLGDEVFTEFYPAFSVKGYQFHRWGTHILLNPHGGFIEWKELPEEPYGHGWKYKIVILAPGVPLFNLLKLFPGFTRKNTGSDEHLILTGD